MAAGFFVRIAQVYAPDSLSVFIVQQLFIITTPAAFLAFNYILYGRFIVECVSREYSWIRPDRVARIFVVSDVTTFLVQVRYAFLLVPTDMRNAKVSVSARLEVVASSHL